MSLLIKWPRIILYVLALLMLVGCASNGATPPQQVATPQPTQSPKPILLTDPVPDPMQPGVQWFSPTGHTLRGIFLDYWNKNGGLAQFGYPITEEFFEPLGADDKLYRVQYFERARFEHHPENAGTPHEVLLGLLGREAAEKKSYFAGAYPRFGHAADFSWISGKLTLYATRLGACGVCGCSILQYGEDSTRFQLAGEVWWNWNYEGALEAGATLVVLGKPAGTGELFIKCPTDTNAPGYIVDHVQTNPVP